MKMSIHVPCDGCGANTPMTKLTSTFICDENGDSKSVYFCSACCLEKSILDAIKEGRKHEWEF